MRGGRRVGFRMSGGFPSLPASVPFLRLVVSSVASGGRGLLQLSRGTYSVFLCCAVSLVVIIFCESCMILREYMRYERYVSMRLLHGTPMCIIMCIRRHSGS